MLHNELLKITLWAENSEQFDHIAWNKIIVKVNMEQVDELVTEFLRAIIQEKYI